MKQTIAELEKRVEILTQELQHSRLENASLQGKIQLAQPDTMAAMAPPPCVPGQEDFRDGSTSVMDVVIRRNSQPQQCIGMGSQFSNALTVTGQSCSSVDFIVSNYKLMIPHRTDTPDNCRPRYFLFVRELRTSKAVGSGLGSPSKPPSCGLQVG